MTQSTAISRRTYVRMVLRQHTPEKLQRFLLHHQSIAMPPKGRVRFGKTAHCAAWRKRQPRPQSINHNISSHLFADGSAAAHAVETRAHSLAKQEHRDAAQGKSTWKRDCALLGLKTKASTSASMNQPQHLVAPMSGWFSGSTRR